MDDVLAVLDAYAYAHRVFEPAALLVLERVKLIDYTGPDIIGELRDLHRRMILWGEGVAKYKHENP